MASTSRLTSVRNRRFGFTLVELLVVIGIIALLISILLPTLNKARESANRTKCLANLRSIGQLVNMYANMSKGQIPIGYSNGNSAAGNNYTENYWMFRYDSAQTPNIRWMGLGFLYPAGLIKDNEVEGMIFYCPSTNDSTIHTMKGTSTPNPWIDDALQADALATAATGKGCRIGYSCRSSNPAALQLNQNQRGVGWIKPTATAPFYPINGWADTTTPSIMMRLSTMKTRAIAADVIIATRTKVAHVKGINVLGADGSARYIDYSMLGDDPAAPGQNILLNMQASSSPNTTVDTFWDRVDAVP